MRYALEFLLQLIGHCVRLVLPLGLLAVGAYAFMTFAEPEEEEKKEPEPPREIRTNVAELKRSDYQVIVKTNGEVRPYNEVTLSALVSGQVVKVSPLFEEGAYFSKGDLLVELDDRDYQTALAIVEARLLGAEAALQLATQNYDRLKKLSTSNHVSEAEITEADANYKQAMAERDSAVADVEQAKRDLERSKIYAPFNGRVRTKSIGLGQMISPGTPLGIAFSVDFAEIRLPLAYDELRFLELPEFESDPPLEIELRDAIDPESTVTWNARIVRTEGVLDENSLDLFAIARVERPFASKPGKPALRIGQPVVASVPGSVLRDVVALPRYAVRQLDRIYMVDNIELTLSSKEITPVWSDESHVIVKDPTLREGDLLSTSQLVYAPEGAKVEIIPDIELTASNTDEDARSRTN